MFDYAFSFSLLQSNNFVVCYRSKSHISAIDVVIDIYKVYVNLINWIYYIDVSFYRASFYRTPKRDTSK